MARAKRDAKPFTMKMDMQIFDRLEQFCKESGQSKTTAVERALTAYMDRYDEEQRIIEEHSDK